MNHKHRIARRRKIAYSIFVTAAFFVTLILIALQFNDARAADKPTRNASDAPMLIVEKYLSTGKEIDMMAQTGWGEARGLTDTEIAAVYWNILNRVDSPIWPGTIVGVITQRNPTQYAGYSSNYPVTDRLRGLAIDVVSRWLLEKLGQEDVGRVLPKEYTYFSGKNGHNVFRTPEGKIWGWRLVSPYEN